MQADSLAVQFSIWIHRAPMTSNARETEAEWLARCTRAAMQPDALLSPADVVRQGWVASLPRLRDTLSQRLLRG